MIISAKFASVCPLCDRRIQPGTDVEWERGAKARHVECAGKLPTAQGPADRPAEQVGATYARLKDGSWGVRVSGRTPTVGEIVTVTTRGGKQKEETIMEVLHPADGDRPALCSVAPKARQARGGRIECEECGDYVEPGSECWETGMVH